MTYGDMITRFFFEAVPTLPVPPEIRFEAISAAVFGTKQRRFGPMPPPEVQVGVRNVLRESSRVEFFLPWAASKQKDGYPLDVLEFMALRQLACLRADLERFGIRSDFTFRVEDHTDRWLFDESRVPQIREYVDAFSRLAAVVLPGTAVYAESDFTSWSSFAEGAEKVRPMFHRYLAGDATDADLSAIGWNGGIPQEQQDYYYRSYAGFYPVEQHTKILAKYFAAALTRKHLKATAVPRTPHVFLTFSHPVPNDPVRNNRLYLRTVPERYTNAHKSPWLAEGYLRVTADGECAPRYVTPEVKDRLTEHTVKLGPVEVYAPYVEE